MFAVTDGSLPIVIVAIVMGIVVLPKILLRHRLEMAKLRRGQDDSRQDRSAEIDALRKRCDALEKRCEELQLQVTDAHAQLADERRQLDLRLANMLPSIEAGNGPGSAARPAVTQKTIN